MNFNDKVVLITGAGRGYGRRIAAAFAAQGARLAVNDISPITLDALVAEIETAGGQAKAYVQDIAKKVAAQGLVVQVEDEFGQVDILVNYSAVEPNMPVVEMDEWDWTRTLTVNLSAAFLMTQSIARMMRQQGGGVIVNVAPLAGRAGQVGGSAYVASMFGLIGFTRQAADELGADHIRVHAVCSGIPELHRAEAGYPSDLVQAALYLCDEAQSRLNGQIINID